MAAVTITVLRFLNASLSKIKLYAGKSSRVYWYSLSMINSKNLIKDGDNPQERLDMKYPESSETKCLGFVK